MKNYKYRAFFALFAAVGLFCVTIVIGIPPAARAAVSGWQNGADIMPAYSTDFSSGSFQQSMKNLAGTGANYATLEIPLYQSNVNTTDVQAGWNTPTDQALKDGINFVHSLGMHVQLKFALFPNDGQWSAYINPSDRASWFTNYKNTVAHYIQIGQSLNVEEVCLGGELIDMSTANANGTNTQNWNSLIGYVRTIFSGKLTYDANWGGSGFPDEKNNINFWPSLDYIGISAYFNLSGDGSVNSLMQSWDGWNKNDISPLAAKWGKPILFEEVGYKSIFDSYTHPWMWWEGGGADENQQMNDYQALFQYWNSQSIVQGVHIWNWLTDPNAGGASNNDYTPQNKTAEGVMKTWFGGGSGTPPPPPPPPPPSNAKFTSSGNGNPGAPAVGQSTAISVTVSAMSGSGSGLNVDLEVYGSGNQQAFQKIFTGQNFSLNSSQTYSANWTPGAVDTYSVKVGVFSADWSQLLYWNNQVFTISAGSSGGGGGTTSGAINIWWPTDGSTVSGVQPFKAMLTNNAADTYAMFWQVDGGQLNGMPTNNTGYPHKESLVDTSPWTWQSSGSYVVNFVAQTLNGQTITQKSITIHVTH